MSRAGFWLPGFGHELSAVPVLGSLLLVPRFGWSCSCGAASGPGVWWGSEAEAEKAGAEHIPSAGVAA